MPKGGKPYPKGKKPGKCVSALALVASLCVGSVAVAAPIGWSEKPLYPTFDHVGISTQLDASGGVGASYRTVLGPIGQATLGANKFELILLSVGAGVLNQPDGGDTETGVQLGFVPVCLDDRSVCFEITAQKVASRDPASHDEDIRYLGTFLVRPISMFGGGPQ